MDVDAIETIEKDGWTVSLYGDNDPMSPDEWDRLGTFEHGLDYTFGSPQSGDWDRFGDRTWDVYARALSIFGDDVAAALPVYVADYGSSGLRAWETADGANAVLYTTHKRLTELCGDEAEYHSKEWATEALREELKTWSQYLEGDVYGYVVTRPDGEHDDSCWGFYGLEYATQEAKEALDACIEHEAQTVEQINRITAL